MFLSKCRCCGTCNCPPYGNKDNFAPWTDGYSPCCGETCMPCSLTMTLTPGTEWFGGSPLTAEQREDIRNFLSRSIVCQITEKNPITYYYTEPSIHPDGWRAGLLMTCDCSLPWNIESNGVFFNYPFGNTTGFATLASGVQIRRLFFPAFYGTDQYGQYTIGCLIKGSDWCGLSSYDATFTITPHQIYQSPFVRPQRIEYSLPPDYSINRIANLRGSTIRYQW